MSCTILQYEPDKPLAEHDSLESLGEASPGDKPGSITWVDIETEDPEEFSTYAQRFGLHELTVEDCLTPGHLPKLEDYGSYLFMIFRGFRSNPELLESWNREDDEDPPDDQESNDYYTRKVAIYLSHNMVVTFRRKEVPWLDAMVRQARQDPELFLSKGARMISHRVVDVLFDRMARGTTFFDRVIDEFEEDALENTNDTLDVADLLELKRELSALRQIMRSQRSVISRLSHDPLLVPERHIRRYFKDIDDHAVALLAIMDKQIDNTLGIRDAYLAMANVRLGDTMRVLTVITTVAAPMHLVVGFYGMNFEVIPLLHNPYGFWFIIFLMLVLAVLMIGFFRKNDWI